MTRYDRKHLRAARRASSPAPYSPLYRLALVKPDWTVELYLVT
jgi:hypothetical protein